MSQFDPLDVVVPLRRFRCELLLFGLIELFQELGIGTELDATSIIFILIKVSQSEASSNVKHANLGSPSSLLKHPADYRRTLAARCLQGSEFVSFAIK